MANKKISDETLKATPSAADLLLIVDSDDGANKKVTVGTLPAFGPIAIPSANLTAQGVTISATVDTNAEGIGAPLFIAADGHFDTADADSDTTAPCVALALETGTGTKSILLYGLIRNDAWNWTIGPGKVSLIYLDTTTGTLTQTQPTGTDDVIQVVGWALSADVMFFNPQLNYITHV
jgi:hypothetical protein